MMMRGLVRYSLPFLLLTSLSAESVDIPPVQRMTLKNGLKVLLIEKRGIPTVNFVALVTAGAINDPAGMEGLGAVTAGLLRKGTERRTAEKFSEELDSLGAGFGAEAGDDFATISIECLSKDLDRGLDLFSDALLHPSFPEAEIEKTLSQRRDGLRSDRDNAPVVLGRYYRGYLFQGAEFGYGRPPSGDEDSLKRIGRGQVVSFYQVNYRLDHTILAVAGDFDAKDLRSKLERTFEGGGRRGDFDIVGQRLPTHAPPAKGKHLLLVDKPDATQTYFAFGNLGVRANDSDRVAIRLVNTIFGGRFTSELNEALRVQSGLTYGADSFFDFREYRGVFGISSFTKNSTTAKTIDLALEVLAKLHREGVTEDELQSAKAYLKGQYPPTLETSGDLARAIATDEFYGLGTAEIREFPSRLDQVTPEIAKRVIDQHFPGADDLVMVVIGKASEIRPQLKKYAATLDEREITDAGFWPPPK